MSLKTSLSAERTSRLHISESMAINSSWSHPVFIRCSKQLHVPGTFAAVYSCADVLLSLAETAFIAAPLKCSFTYVFLQASLKQFHIRLVSHVTAVNDDPLSPAYNCSSR